MRLTPTVGLSSRQPNVIAISIKAESRLKRWFAASGVAALSAMALRTCGALMPTASLACAASVIYRYLDAPCARRLTQMMCKLDRTVSLIRNLGELSRHGVNRGVIDFLHAVSLDERVT